MRFIPQLTSINKIKVYRICCTSVGNVVKRNDLRECLYIFALNSADYSYKAESANLYLMAQNLSSPYPVTPVYENKNCMTTEDKISDMKKLYTEQMVNQKKEGREIYDALMVLAPLNKCPFCGIGQVTTLDHYLPKSIFPIFSVLTSNLIPCCKDCNTGKSTSYATTKERQVLHPYYDDFTKEQWLFAEIKQTFPVSVEFFTNPPIHWDSISKIRVKTHFNEYGLRKRFSVEASNELANLREKFVYFSLSAMDIKSTLSQEAIIYYRKHLNSWQTALYQALSESDWYCSGGYDS